jgi:hypothetical protein
MSDIFDGPRRQIVERVHLVTTGQKRLGEMRSDEARAACDQ